MRFGGTIAGVLAGIGLNIFSALVTETVLHPSLITCSLILTGAIGGAIGDLKNEKEV